MSTRINRLYKLFRASAQIQLAIEAKLVSNGYVEVTAIDGALTRDQLPDCYCNHVPYMLWLPNYSTPELLVNWVGGLDHVLVGNVYADYNFENILRQIQVCSDKLARMLPKLTKTQLIAAYLSYSGEYPVGHNMRPLWEACGRKKEFLEKANKLLIELQDYD